LNVNVSPGVADKAARLGLQTLGLGRARSGVCVELREHLADAGALLLDGLGSVLERSSEQRVARLVLLGELQQLLELSGQLVQPHATLPA
jgi:hypothetical protein